MKIYICIIISVLFGYFSQGQCLVNSLKINTGYDPASGIAVTPGTNGATPVTDPHWILNAVSPGVATAITATVLTGLIEVVPGNKSDVIMGV